jgi:hypothetical protein
LRNRIWTWADAQWYLFPAAFKLPARSLNVQRDIQSAFAIARLIDNKPAR